MSGGAYATLNLGVRYYVEYIKAAGLGGMVAVCETEFFSQRIKENTRNINILMAMDPEKFIEVMVCWMTSFISNENQPMIGASEEDLRNEIVLVLDSGPVILKAGDVVIQRGTSQAWSNQSNNPAAVSISSHDGSWME